MISPETLDNLRIWVLWMKREMEEYSLIRKTRPSLLCFLSLGFGERKVVVDVLIPLMRRGMVSTNLYLWSRRRW